MADGAFGLSKELELATAPVWAKVREHVTPLEWPAQAALIQEINATKRERDAVILAHNYMTPEIFHGVGDYVGDSLGLAKEAARSNAKVIVQAGVHFMAETSKILSPEKTVLIPDLRAGCSLAASITGADVRLIKQRYPGLPVVTRQHHGRREGRDGHLLHQRQRRAGGGVGGPGVGRRPRHPDPR
jgi:quinolinate synthase